MRKGQPWRITYRGWRITHDPLGRLACYRLSGRELYWCYPGITVAAIKAAIDRREVYAQHVQQMDA